MQECFIYLYNNRLYQFWLWGKNNEMRRDTFCWDSIDGTMIQIMGCHMLKGNQEFIYRQVRRCDYNHKLFYYVPLYWYLGCNEVGIKYLYCTFVSTNNFNSDYYGLNKPTIYKSIYVLQKMVSDLIEILQIEVKLYECTILKALGLL